MNDMHAAAGLQYDEPGSSFAFTGTWREYLPITLTNLALTIVTLGIYRFWAKARERRYLWGRTRFIDDRLEWTGTGKEMFVGFLLVMAILIPTVLLIQFAVQALALRGQFFLAGILLLALYLGLLYFVGVAWFRALRYRLSRTYWHGIRGGSDDAGWSYGGSALGKTIAAGVTAGLLTPWMMTRLWNERWNKMSFGPYAFQAHADSKGLKRRWLLIYVGGFVAAMALFATQFAAIMNAAANPAGTGAPPELALSAVLGVLAFYAVMLLASLAYYAAYYRKVVGATALATLDFTFTARTKDWLLLILGSIGLVVVTLGVGLIFLGYRNWSFAMRHLEASGEIDLLALTQSPTRAATDAEGLASAFDIGAI